MLATWATPEPGTLTLESSGHSLDQSGLGPGTLTLESSGHSLETGQPFFHIGLVNLHVLGIFDKYFRILFLLLLPSPLLLPRCWRCFISFTFFPLFYIFVFMYLHEEMHSLNHFFSICFLTFSSFFFKNSDDLISSSVLQASGCQVSDCRTICWMYIYSQPHTYTFPSIKEKYTYTATYTYTCYQINE